MDLSPLVHRIGQGISTFTQYIGPRSSTSVQRIGRWLSTSMQYIGSRISNLALIIAFGALIVSLLQYYAVTRHYRLSVRPHVVPTFVLEGGKDERNGIYIANPGLGPAIIKAVLVEVGGKSYDATDKRVWQNISRDLAIIRGCLRGGWVESGNALKSGDEWALVTITHADPPVVGEHSCHIELLKFLKAEDLKVHIQYESMYGEPYEVIRESWIDNDTISDVTTVMIQQLVPKLAEQLQSTVAQLKQLGDQMQQSNVEFMKRMAGLAGLMLLRELYEDPPGAPTVKVYLGRLPAHRQGR